MDSGNFIIVADQRPVISVWPERLGEGAEAFGDADEIEKVNDFLTTVAEIESLTSLDFGDEVRSGDIRAGESMQEVTSLDDVPVAPKSKRGRRKQARKKRGRRP